MYIPRICSCPGLIALYDLCSLFSLFLDNSLTKFSQREASLEKLLGRSDRFIRCFHIFGTFLYETNLNSLASVRVQFIYFIFFFSSFIAIRSIRRNHYVRKFSRAFLSRQFFVNSSKVVPIVGVKIIKERYSLRHESLT